MRKILFVWMLLCVAVPSQAQLNSLLNKVVSTVTGTDKVSEKTLLGTWTFAGTGIELKAQDQNILTNLGGTAGAAVVEKKVDEYLSKAGLVAGKFSLEFKENNVLVATGKDGKTRTGTYTIKDDHTVIIKLMNVGSGMTCQTEISVKDLKLMVSADKLMNLASTLSGVLASRNTSMAAINTLLKKYKGMNVGMKFTK